MSQVLGAFGLLDFTMLRHIHGVHFETCGMFISLILRIFWGRGKLQILNADTGVCLYIYLQFTAIYE